MTSNELPGNAPALGPVMAHLDHCRVTYGFTTQPNPSSGPTAQAQVVLADGRPWLVLSAGSIELAAVARALHVRKVTVPSDAALPGLGVPARLCGFGRVHGMKTLIDSALMEHPRLRVPTGVDQVCAELDTEDLATMEKPLVAAVTGHRKGAAHNERLARAG